MRHAKKFAVSLVFTSLLYNNCSGLKNFSEDGTQNLSSIGTETFVVGVDPNPTPTPVPMGTPKPFKVQYWGNPVPPPALQAQLPKYPSNFDTSEWLFDDPTTDVKNGYSGEGGAFRFICKPSHNLYDDPIVYPGQAGASHLHTFFGNTMANGHSTYESLRKTGDGTCAGGPLNRSGYWIPSLKLDDGDRNFENDKVIMPDNTIVYYKMDPEKATVFPRGLRLIFGYDMNNPAKSSSFKWICLSNTGVGAGDFRSLQELAAAGCPAGSQIEAFITGPTCWDGRLDSPDHRSHMAFVSYGNTGVGGCPTTHPQNFVAFTLGVMWTVGPEGPAEIAKMYLSSDKMHNSVPGSTFHTDWFGAWDDDILAEWMVQAVADRRNTSSGVFSNGRGLLDPYKKTNKDGYSRLLDKANPRLVTPPARR